MWTLLLLGAALAATGSTAPQELPGGSAPHARVVVFEGTCDASGAVPLGRSRFIVGDDEDNVLRIYDGHRGGAPLAASDLSPGLGLPARRRPAETDIEAATASGSLAFWLTSHGTRKSGKRDESRLRFFATTMPEGDEPAALVGKVYVGLLADLVAAPQLAPFELARAAARPPQERGGLNIEGMTAAPDGRSIVIGFRSPVRGGKALVVPILNPHEVVREGRARFGEPSRLDLGGLGIRSMSWWRGRYLLVAGGVAGEARSRLFTWAGGEDVPVALDTVDFADLNPEAFVTPEDGDEILILSDDGEVLVDGTACKRLKDAARKRFRGFWLRLPLPAPAAVRTP
jgi:hypothetical protein